MLFPLCSFDEETAHRGTEGLRDSALGGFLRGLLPRKPSVPVLTAPLALPGIEAGQALNALKEFATATGHASSGSNAQVRRGRFVFGA